MVLLLLACANIHVESNLEGCDDVDFDNRQASDLLSEAGDEVIRVYRTYDYQEATDLTWDPTIDAAGGVVHVYEAWTGGSSEDPYCYEPGVLLSGVEGIVQVRWYLSTDDAVPWDTVDVKTE